MLRYPFAGYGLTVLQLALLLITTGIFTFTCGGWRCSGSVLLGGSAWIIPSLYFVRKFLNKRPNRSSQMMLNNFLLDETIKLLLSFGLIVLFLFIFKIKALEFLSGYTATIFASLLMPLLY